MRIDHSQRAREFFGVDVTPDAGMTLHQLASVDESSGSAGLTVVLLALATLIVVAIVVPLAVIASSRRIVSDTSTAIAGLRELNSRYVNSVTPLPVLSCGFRYTAKSKLAFERFDLAGFMLTCVLENEQWLEQEIAARATRMRYYIDYSRELGRLGEEAIGSSIDGRLKPQRYLKVEKRLFQNQILAAPTPLATVVATASYTSPQGQNSYSARLVWDFAALEAGMIAARRERERRSTTEYLRSRERSLMTPKLRTDILRRDGSRCRMCGASARDGATLHIDHIIPVSHGGRTIESNLQTLCQSCNLGKSNRFVG